MMAAKLKKFGVPSNSLWPQTVLNTEALKIGVKAFANQKEACETNQG